MKPESWNPTLVIPQRPKPPSARVAAQRSPVHGVPDLLEFVNGEVERAFSTVQETVHGCQVAAHVLPDGEQATRVRQVLNSVEESLEAGHRGTGDTRLRVLLMGRTQAGKSTLFEVLTAGDGQRIGDGRQRYSRDVSTRPCVKAPGILLRDTPGVGAHDGEQDYRLAMAQVADSDLVVWVAASDSHQEDTVRALREVAAAGKPIMVVLNCWYNIEHRVKQARFLESPDVAYGQVAGHFSALNRQLNRVGVRPAAALPIHAHAGFVSTRTSNSIDGPSLWDASRIETLLVAMRREASHRLGQRQLVRTVDRRRSSIVSALVAIDDLAGQSERHIARQRDILNDAQKSGDRLIKREHQSLVVATDALIDQVRAWPDTVTDFGKGLKGQWSQRSSQLFRQLKEQFESSERSLVEQLRQSWEEAEAYWAAAPHIDTELNLSTGFASAHANRALKVGVGAIELGAIAGGVKLGGIVGAKVGVVGGPPGVLLGAVAGAAAGALAGLALKPLKNLIDSIFMSKDALLRRRRRELSKQVGKVVDKITATTHDQAQHLADHYQGHLDEHVKTIRSDHARWDGVIQAMRLAASSVENTLQVVDVATAWGLLRLAGNPEVANGLVNARRIPGVAMCVQLQEPAYTRWALLPDDFVVEVVAAAPYHGRSASLADAVQYCMGLTDAALESAPGSGTITLRSAANRNILEHWQSLLGLACNGPNQVRLIGNADRRRNDG